MKQSEKALITVVGILAGLVIASVALSRVSGTSIDLNSSENVDLSNQELVGFNRIDVQGD